MKNTIKGEEKGELLSNYALAFGKSSLIQSISDFFDESGKEDEVSVVHLENDYSLLSVTNSESFQSINNSMVFFKGWFQEHAAKSIVLGQQGFNQWLENNPGVSLGNEFEGSYISAIFDKQKLVVRNDLFSFLPVIYFSNKELFVCSDSMYIISEIRKLLDLPCEINRNVMHSRAWTHGLACAAMSNDSQIQNVKLLSPGKHIEIKLSKGIFSSTTKLQSKKIIKSKDLKELFATKYDNYNQAIRDAAVKMAQSTMSLLYLEGVLIKFGLSGGLDSRIILAAVLHRPELLQNLSITTNTHPSRKNDFDIVKKLSEQFSFKFNDDENIKSHRKKHPFKLKYTDDRFALWVLSSMGLFDMMYIHDSYWPNPRIIDMGGHGGETIKGTHATNTFEDYIDPQIPTGEVYDSIRSEISSALGSHGIQLDEFASMQWHHLCFKSPIQNGRFLDCSSIAIRPFIQHSLYALAVSEINPFRSSSRRIWGLSQSGLKEPTLLHDMLILLSPELAAIEFENSKINSSERYIESRLKELGGRLNLEAIEPYTIYGSVDKMKNGPPDCFLRIVKHDFKIDEDDTLAIENALERTWSKITDNEIKSAYQSAYDLAKTRLANPDFYPPSAGTPAAKIISLSLLD